VKRRSSTAIAYDFLRTLRFVLDAFESAQPFGSPPPSQVRCHDAQIAVSRALGDVFEFDRVAGLARRLVRR
jgi:hypothetical protein